MILLIPTSPEVTKQNRPQLWPSLIMLLILLTCYMKTYPSIEEDSDYVETIQVELEKNFSTVEDISREAAEFLKKRPLLKIAPAKGDWDIKRLIYANFIHGTPAHLILNLVGAFACIRICSTFIPFLCSLAVFILGGSFGLFVSLFATQQFSDFIPHVGASSGIFTLMGLYYVFNFKYRTSYFFWFPSRRRGFISLKTSWFFFVDVILLELILSTAQFFPDALDGVDHIAHVVGFGSGVLIAVVLRAVLRWPSFIQSRTEFIYWTNFALPKLEAYVENEVDPSPLFSIYLELIEINRYNDQLRLKAGRLLVKDLAKINNEKVEEYFRTIGPTFVRLYSTEMNNVIHALYNQGRAVPNKWLSRTPYDSIIRMAKLMTQTPANQHTLFKLLIDYRKNNSQKGDIDRKLESLLKKVELFMNEGQIQGGNFGNASKDNIRISSAKEKQSKMGKAAS